MDAPPGVAEAGLVVRSIPSGTQVVSGTVVANQGTPAVNANRWPVQLTDGLGNFGALLDTLARAGFVRNRRYDGLSGLVPGTYHSVYRLAARPYALSFAIGAGARKQFATIHHAATAIKRVRLRHVWVAVQGSTVASILHAELRQINSAPATGNPVITPKVASADIVAAEVTCLALPTTAGTELGGPFADCQWNLGVTAAGSVVNPPPPIVWRDLLRPGGEGPPDHEAEQPVIRAGNLDGWAVTFDSSAATTITAYVTIEFTEET